MNGASSVPGGPKVFAWWRRRWFWLAMAVLAAEVGVVRLLSANENQGGNRNRKPLPRYRVVTEEEGSRSEADAMVWSMLMSPSVLLMPSEYDFSGAAWLGGSSAEVALESFAARVQPLPFQPIRGEGGVADALPRLDPGPASRWEVTEAMGGLPSVAPVALPADGRVRIVEGFAGWRLEPGLRLEPLPGGLLVPRAVVRVSIDADGTPAGPPVIWETSGEGVADEAALVLVRRMRWVRETPESVPAHAQERSWGLVAVSWPAPRETGPAVEAARKP